MKTSNSGFTMVEVMVAFALSSVLILAVTSVSQFSARSDRATRNQLDYGALANEVYSIVSNDTFCSIALTAQSMNGFGAQNVRLYAGSPPTVRFSAAAPQNRFNSIVIDSIQLDTIDPTKRPTAIGGVWPSKLTLLVHGDGNPLQQQTITALLSVTTSPTLSIVKCTKIRFSDQSYAAPVPRPGDPECPTSGPVFGCTNPNVPFLITLANDGVTPICVPDWKQCCDIANGFYPQQALGTDPRISPYNVYRGVSCVAPSCDTLFPDGVTRDTYAKGMCCSHGLTVSGTPSTTAADPTLDGMSCI